MERSRAVERICEMVAVVETDLVPVPIREIWVLPDLSLGLDPVERIHVFLAKDLLFASDTSGPEHHAPERDSEFRKQFGIAGVGKSVSAAWAAAFPEHLVANDHGHAAPERCLAAHLLRDGEPIHLEICNAGFERTVIQRLKAATDRGTYDTVLDPRGVCVWKHGTKSESAPTKLEAGEYAFPPLVEALVMLGMGEAQAAEAATAMREWRSTAEGTSMRADVV